jgi:ERF superfamily
MAKTEDMLAKLEPEAEAGLDPHHAHQQAAPMGANRIGMDRPMNVEHEIQTVSETPVAAADASSIMAVIARAAGDPNTDVEKLERLAGLYERITARSAEQAFDAAMGDAQGEMRPIAADANNPQTRSRYASYAALDRALRPIYTKHGFSLSFGTGDGAPPDFVRVICRVGHRHGHRQVEHVDMPADGKGAKGGDVMTKTHATGAALTYGQRYLLKLIFNIAVGDDDDGNGAAFPGDWIGEQQVSDLLALIEEVGADRQKFLDWLKIDTLAHLPRKRLPDALRALEAKRSAQ